MGSVVESIAVWSLRRQGFTSRHVPTQHGRVHLMQAPGGGALPPIVLLHGLGARGAQYQALVRALRPHTRRLILPDAPGHGLSDAPPEPTVSSVAEGLNEALVSALDEPSVVFGNSMGGYLAIRFASRHPERVLGLMVNSPSGAPVPPERRAVLKRRFSPEGHAEALELVSRVFTQRGPQLHLLAVLARAQLSRPWVRSLVCGVGEHDELSVEELRRLPRDSLVLWGEQERALLDEQREFFAQHLPPGARLERPVEYGHSPHLERPGELCERILRFTRGLAPA
jgi:pimeloyl-ACP methyl ester carboxylesterase